MHQRELEGLVKEIDARTTRIEQILPTLATKDELKAFPTRQEVSAMIQEEGRQTRSHFDAVREDLQRGIKVITDGHKALEDRITSLGRDIKSVLANHEGRITKLETNASKRR